MLSYNSGGFWVSEYRHRGKSTETEQKLSEREKHHKEKENIKQSPMKKEKKSTVNSTTTHQKIQTSILA